METKTLILIRHAHRDKKLGREIDNGLSPKGRAQVAEVRAFYKKRFSGARAQFISSPKKRCTQTLGPLATFAKAKIKLSVDLDEGGNVDQKARNFFLQWKRNPSALTVVSSHGDWIPVFTELAFGIAIDISKAGWIEIVQDTGSLRLTWVIQTWNF